MTIPALRFEIKKDDWRQLQNGTYKLTVTVNPTDLDDNGDALMLDFIKAPMGQRYMLGMAAIGDDEEPVTPTPEPERPKKAFRDRPRSSQAFLKCDDMKFRNFIGVATNAEAADWVRQYCNVTSRAELDTCTMAGAHWDRLLTDYDQVTNRMAEQR